MARSDQVRVYKNQNQMDIALFQVTEKAVLNMAYNVAIGSANTFSLIRLPHPVTRAWAIKDLLFQGQSA